MNLWMKATNTIDKQHPKCEGKTCGSWNICNACETYFMVYGCIYYDEKVEEQMIDDEIKAGI